MFQRPSPLPNRPARGLFFHQCHVPRAVVPLSLLGVVLGLWACTPTLNWRALPLPDTPLHMQWPCKPQAEAREVDMAGYRIRLRVHVCDAGGTQWAVADAQLQDPAAVNPVLAVLLDSWLTHLRAPSPAAPHPVASIAGMTPFQNARQVSAPVRKADGTHAWTQAVTFAHGTHVYRVSCLSEGDRPPSETSAFFAALTLLP